MSLGSDPLSSPSLERALPRETVDLLKKLGGLAQEEGVQLYLVGGLVRDLFLDVSSVDLDIVVAGDGLAFARRAGRR